MPVLYRTYNVPFICALIHINGITFFDPRKNVGLLRKMLRTIMEERRFYKYYVGLKPHYVMEYTSPQSDVCELIIVDIDGHDHGLVCMGPNEFERDAEGNIHMR